VRHLVWSLRGSGDPAHPSRIVGHARKRVEQLPVSLPWLHATALHDDDRIAARIATAANLRPFFGAEGGYGQGDRRIQYLAHHSRIESVERGARVVAVADHHIRPDT